MYSINSEDLLILLRIKRLIEYQSLDVDLLIKKFCHQIGVSKISWEIQIGGYDGTAGVWPSKSCPWPCVHTDTLLVSIRNYMNILAHLSLRLMWALLIIFCQTSLCTCRIFTCPLFYQFLPDSGQFKHCWTIGDSGLLQ